MVGFRKSGHIFYKLGYFNLDFSTFFTLPPNVHTLGNSLNNFINHIPISSADQTIFLSELLTSGIDYQMRS